MPRINRVQGRDQEKDIIEIATKAWILQVHGISWLAEQLE